MDGFSTIVAAPHQWLFLFLQWLLSLQAYTGDGIAQLFGEMQNFF